MVWWLFHSLNPCYTDSVVVVDKGCEKAILHLSNKSSQAKTAFRIFGLGGLIADRLSLERRLLGKRDCYTAFVTALYESVFL